MQKTNSLLTPLAIGAALVFGPALLGGSLPGNPGAALAQDDAEQQEQETRKTPAMREKVYKRLAKAQEAMEAGDPGTALSELESLKRQKDLNSYELAQMHTFYGYLYFDKEDYPNAIRSYENVLAQEALPLAMETGTRYSLAQLYFATENYPKAVEALNAWFKVANNPGPDPYILLGQAYYQTKEYNKAIPPILKGMELAQERGKEIKENWYLILRVIYFEQGENQKVADILETLVRLYPKKEYWIQLSGMYGELGKPRQQTLAYEMAYLQGLLTSGREIVTLSQLLLQSEVPYRAATILEKAINDGSVEGNAKNYRLLSQAWMVAAEDEKAIPALVEAARLSGDGELDVRLAQSYLNTDNWEGAVDAAKSGIAKGGVKRVDQANMILGMALYELERYNEALRAFREAAKDSRSAKVGAQWVQHIEKEKERVKQLADARRRG
ncbi:MAG: tetratricopeptide repeat protein [Pseudomonadota bacterium]